MLLLIIIPMKNGYFIGKINPTFSDKPSQEKAMEEKLWRKPGEIDGTHALIFHIYVTPLRDVTGSTGLHWFVTFPMMQTSQEISG